MEDDFQRTASVDSSVTTLGNLVRVAATVLGLVAIIVGLVYAVKIFDVVYHNVRQPEGVSATIDKWEDVLGADEFVVNIQNDEIRYGRVVTIAVIGVAALALVHIAMGIMAVGAKIVSITAGDREAVKKILTHAFGPTQRPPSRP